MLNKLFKEVWDLIQEINFFGVTDSIVMGIKLWFAPQISEHCPKYSPPRLAKKLIWFNRPGVASTFTPNLGIVHEWSTSAAVINIRIWEFMGIIVRVSTSKSRVILFLMSLEGNKNESNSILIKSEYS